MLTLAVIVLIVFSVFLLAVHKNGRCSFGIPGPWRLPVIGCMYLIRWFSQPHKKLTEFAKVYGNVYYVRLGSQNVVVINSAAAVKEALFHKGSDFSGRPSLFSFGLWDKTKMSLIFRDFSPHFVSNKCAVEMSMRALLNDVETLNLRTSNALNSLLGKFESFSQNRTSLDPRGPALECISDFVMGHAFGNTISRCFFHEARAVLKESLSFIDIAFVGSCMDYVGFMRSINKNQIDKTVTDVTRLREFVTKVYNVHKSSMLQTSDYRTSLALRLRQLKDTIPEKQYSFAGLTTGDGLELDEEMIVSLLTDITFSAYEKISTALLWCIARLAESLPLQMELQDNLDQLGQEKLSLNDKPRYPLLDAFISETLRTSCIMPFGLPRRTVRETTICGINIPKDTTVLLNLWSCAYDPKVYKNPELFNPKRFLTEDVNGKTQIRCPSFPAFSAGHRRCLGDTLSRSVLFFLVGGMLQNYSMELEDESMKSNLEGKYALTLRPKRYKINLQKRIKNFDKRH